MRVAVIGAGGVGGYFGAMLAGGGEDVMLTARGRHLESLQRDGLRVVTQGGMLRVPAGRCVAGPADIGPADVVLFCVKSYDTERAARTLTPLLKADTIVISLQNGIENEDALGAILPGTGVLGGVAYIYSTITRPGEVTVSPGPARMVFGAFAGAPDAARRGAEAFHAACTHAGISADISPDITADLWKKFIFITGAGGITALTRLTLGEILAVPETRDLLTDTMRETEAVARARGVRIPPDFLEGVFATLARFDNNTRSSLYYDLVSGKPLEIEALAGTVLRLGRTLGVPTPVNRAIYAALLPHHVHNVQGRP